MWAKIWSKLMRKHKKIICIDKNIGTAVWPPLDLALKQILTNAFIYL